MPRLGVAFVAASAVFAASCAGLLGIEETKDEPGATPNGEGGAEVDGPTSSGDRDGEPPGMDGGADAPSGDADLDAGDSAVPPPDCDLTKPFGAPQALSNAVNTSAYETGGRLSVDELTLYFTRASTVYKATRGNKTDPFANVTPMADINGTTADGYLTMPASEVTAFFASNRTGSALLDIWSATRSNKTAAFMNIKREAILASAQDDDDPWVRADARMLYFDSKRSGVTDLYRAPIDATGTIGTPSKVLNVTTDSDSESNPVVTADDLTLYFAFGATTGSQGIRVSKRASTNVEFSGITSVTELNTSSDDRPTWVSPDGCKILISSERPNGQGSSDLYMAVKPK